MGQRKSKIHYGYGVPRTDEAPSRFRSSHRSLRLSVSPLSSSFITVSLLSIHQSVRPAMPAILMHRKSSPKTIIVLSSKNHKFGLEKKKQKKMYQWQCARDRATPPLRSLGGNGQQALRRVLHDCHVTASVRIM